MGGPPGEGGAAFESLDLVLREYLRALRVLLEALATEALPVDFCHYHDGYFADRLLALLNLVSEGEVDKRLIARERRPQLLLSPNEDIASLDHRSCH